MIETKKYVVGLTGGIASGKSTIANFFKNKGIEHISADVVAKDLMQAGSKLILEIEHVFQTEFKQNTLLTTESELNRTKLREIIFNSKRARQRLDELTHPAIKKELLKRIHTAQSVYVIVEIPLLIEANMQAIVNRILAVETTPSSQLKRIMQRDQVDIEHAQKILNAQLSNEQRRAHSDDIIRNEGHLEQVNNAVKLMHQKYLYLAAKPTISTDLGLALI